MNYIREEEYQRICQLVADGSSYLHIVGGIGSGKTVLLERLKQRFADQPQITFSEEASVRATQRGATHIQCSRHAVSAPDAEIVRLEPLSRERATQWLERRVRELGGIAIEGAMDSIGTLGGIPTLLEAAAQALLTSSRQDALNPSNTARIPKLQAWFGAVLKKYGHLERKALATLAAFEESAEVHEVPNTHVLIRDGLVLRSNDTLTLVPALRWLVRHTLSQPVWHRAAAEHARIVLARQSPSRAELTAVLERTQTRSASIAFEAAMQLGNSEALTSLIEQGDIAQARCAEALLSLARRETQARKALGYLERAQSLVPATSATLLANIHVEQGYAAQRAGQTKRAWSLYTKLLEQRRLAHEVRTRAELNLGTLLHDELRFDEARDYYERALAGSEPRVEGAAWLNLGVLHHEEGNFARAERCLKRAIPAFVRAGDMRLEAIATSSLGSVMHERGFPEKALVYHARAQQGLYASTDRVSFGLTWVRTALALASLQRTEEAETALGSCEKDLLSEGESALRRLLVLTSAFVRMHAGLRVDADALLDVRNAPGAHTASTYGDDVRFVLRLLRAELQRRNIPLRALSLDRKARTLTTENGTAFALGAHGSAWRMLVALYDAGEKRLSAMDLWQAGWPNEQARDGAWQNRVYVALTVLRSKGLRNHLVRDERGYSLVQNEAKDA